MRLANTAAATRSGESTAERVCVWVSSSIDRRTDEFTRALRRRRSEEGGDDTFGKDDDLYRAGNLLGKRHFQKKAPLLLITSLPT